MRAPLPAAHYRAIYLLLFWAYAGWNGERLAYHQSDLIYFGNSLRWRREMIYVTDLEAYHRPGGQGYDYARRIAQEQLALGRARCCREGLIK